MKHSNPSPSTKTTEMQKASYEKLLDSLGNASLETTRVFLADRETAVPEEGITEDIIARLEKRIADSGS
ncbi:hypothetical protein [Candidatus Leptofilum sp.]|uniref:hypothetical protein n=1 Tax=Candidatus Leptofilum sp. TaxID=3241576 RepID=UPI003B5A1232